MTPAALCHCSRMKVLLAPGQPGESYFRWHWRASRPRQHTEPPRTRFVAVSPHQLECLRPRLAVVRRRAPDRLSTDLERTL